MAALGGQKRRQINCRRPIFPNFMGNRNSPGAVCAPESLSLAASLKKALLSQKRPTGRRSNSPHLSPFFSAPGFSFIYPKGLTASQRVFAACPQQMERSHQRQDLFPIICQKPPVDHSIGGFLSAKRYAFMVWLQTVPQISSMIAISAASPRRGPILMIRV